MVKSEAVRPLLICDDLPLRRAELLAFLGPWSEEVQVRLLDQPLAEFLASTAIDPDCRMVIVSVGSVSLGETMVLEKVRMFADAHAEIPVAVLSEDASSRIAAQTFQAGARGFIPASTEPDVALRALTFILNGGHFFPPSALQMLPGLNVGKPAGESSNGNGASSPFHGDIELSWQRHGGARRRGRAPG